MEGVGGQDSVFHRSRSEKWRQITHGEGVYLFDSEGRRYLDACAGVHVVSIGHGVPEIAGGDAGAGPQLYLQSVPDPTSA